MNEKNKSDDSLQEFDESTESSVPFWDPKLNAEKPRFAENSTAPIFVIIGGNASCHQSKLAAVLRAGLSPYRLGMFNSYLEHAKNLEAKFGVTPDYLLICYKTSIIPLNRPREVMFASSTDPDNFHTGDDEDIIKEVAEMLIAHRPVNIVGWSYGGWFSLKLAEILTQTRKINGLFLIDPTSPYDCRVFSLKGCDKSPSDIPVETKKFIATQTRHFINYIQAQDQKDLTRIVSPSEIAEAHKNVSVEATHTSITTDEKVWAEIELLSEDSFL